MGSLAQTGTFATSQTSASPNARVSTTPKTVQWSNSSHCHQEEATSVEADVMTGTTGDPARSIEFFGTSSAGSFLRQINSAIDARLGNPQTPAAYDLDGVRSMESSSNAGKRDFNPKNLEDYILPPRNYANGLLESYYDLVWTVLPVHDWTIFQQAYEAVWLGSKPVIPEATLYCLLNLTFALGSQFFETIEPSKRRGVGHNFWRRARRLFGPETHHGASIERVQCMLLMGLYLQSTCDTYECWMTIGSAIRMAQSLGLHLSTSKAQVPSGPGSRGVEIARRVWHGCVYMDRVLSMTFGRPSMIARWPPDAVQVPLPSMIDDEFLDTQTESSPIRPDGLPTTVAFFVKTIELYDIVNDILLGLYQGSADITNNQLHHLVAVLQFDDRLLRWEQSLPKHLQYFPENADETHISQRQRIVLRARYLQARIVVLRPILADYYLKQIGSKGPPTPKERSLSQHLVVQSAELCFDAAHEMVDVLYEHFNFESVTGPVPAWWFAVLFVYTSATVLLAERLRPIEDKPRVRDAMSKSLSWDRALQLLRAYSRVGQSAERCVTALGILSAKIHDATLYGSNQGEMCQPQPFEDDAIGDNNDLTNIKQAMTESSAFQFSLDDLDFNIDDMFWLNTSAADIIS